MSRAREIGVSAVLAACLTASPAAADAVVVVRSGSVDDALARRVEQQIRTHRSVVPLRPLPPVTESPEKIANEERAEAIARALERARRQEEVAAWYDCAKEAGDRLGDATEILATAGNLALLRDLHLQIGACTSLSDSAEDAQPHFRTATLLDERPPPAGMHREEAELALERARAEVLARRRGPIHLDTDPPGAEVWIDGVKVSGTTPLDVPVRLGNHFVTLRRFRFEPTTTQALLQPKSTLRFVLSPAQRDTLRRQLAEVGAGTRKAPGEELAWARARFSGADALVVLSAAHGPTRTPALKVEVIEPESGATQRSQLVPQGIDDEDLRQRVCKVLGESCPEEAGGIPWYVWPIAGVAVTGGAVALGLYLDNQRGTVFCAADGC